jgi:hypothetical protein
MSTSMLPQLPEAVLLRFPCRVTPGWHLGTWRLSCSLSDKGVSLFLDCASHVTYGKPRFPPGSLESGYMPGRGPRELSPPSTEPPGSCGGILWLGEMVLCDLPGTDSA